MTTWPAPIDRLTPKGGWSFCEHKSVTERGVVTLGLHHHDVWDKLGAGPNTLLTVAQVAQLRGITVDTVKGMLRRGTMTGRKLGKIWVIEAGEAVRIHRVVRAKDGKGRFCNG